MTTLKNKLDTLTQASLAVQEHMRAERNATHDAQRARSAGYTNDAARSDNRRGVSIIMRDDGLDIVPIGDVSATVREAPLPEDVTEPYKAGHPEHWTESYKQMSAPEFEKAVKRSHERSNETKGKVEQQIHLGPGDAALQAEKRAEQDAADAKHQKQVRDTARAKADYAEGIARTEKFAAAIKAHNEKHAGR